VWLFILPFGIAMLAVEEVRKWIIRRSTVLVQAFDR